MEETGKISIYNYIPKHGPLHKRHRELFHYTTWEGLKGIWSSGTLWATRYDCLNDYTEISHLKDPLVKALIPKMVDKMKDFGKKGFKERTLVQKSGGNWNSAKNEAECLVSAIYGATVENRDTNNNTSIPFITSFCSHSRDDSYEKENGLLSQWRAYGGMESFAIVFDTKIICDLVFQSFSSNTYWALFIDDVIYNYGSDTVISECAPLIDEFCRVWDIAIKDQKEWKTSIYMDFMSRATRFKHRGFYEEREVRIVACPMTKESSDKYNISKHFPPKHDLHQIRTRTRSEKEVSYASLFSHSGKKKLPINKIIVGPGPNQNSSYEKAKALVGNSAYVTKSSTPYIW
ncbi:DUF2971 domain-containing protein [Azospirillum thiophilum]|nr:DUF2971 domain-containing protein [Azospirillum thiophilum]